MARIEALLDGATGSRSRSSSRSSATARPIDTPLMDAIRDWVGEQSAGRGGGADGAAGVHRLAHWSATRSRTASAYGFFPQRHMSLYETWPLIHSDDERIDVRDLGFAAEFFDDLPRRLLA